ncbi:isochorismate synthase [Agaribacterium sp. ZY112]|uniref:isochorismate synthase n=1 Tax=Agaribacterium sp. ZY112 TaxID=3233574 RepID=UPI00352659B3
MKRTMLGSAQMAQAIEDYQQHSKPFFFSNGSMALLGIGKQKSLNVKTCFSNLDSKVRELLTDSKTPQCDNPVALGIIPFCESETAKFIVPEQLYVASSLRPEHLKTKQPTPTQPPSIAPEPKPSDYTDAVQKALKEMTKGRFEKVVLSRALTIQSREPIALNNLLATLLKQNSKGYTFCAEIGEGENKNSLIGSSPELLVSRKGRQVCSNPLAGSRKRDIEENKNETLSFSLLESDKDLREHSLVVEAVENTLQNHCSNLYSPMLPSVISTPSMLHLSSYLEGTLQNESTSVLKLATDLHPTPAVCGFPKEAAKQFIDQQEPFDRRYFTGLVGWVDSRGNGEWVVVIRSAEVSEFSVKVFAGAGIVEGSIPNDELDETGNKMRTILNALNISLDSEGKPKKPSDGVNLNRTKEAETTKLNRIKILSKAKEAAQSFHKKVTIKNEERV